MRERRAEGLSVVVGEDGRVEVRGDGVTLVLQEEATQIGVRVYDSLLMVGQMLVATDAVEVIQAGDVSGRLIEWVA